MDNLDVDEMKDVYGDLNDFDQRLKGTSGLKFGAGNDDSSEEDVEPAELIKRRQDPLWQEQEKNRVLIDRLYKSEKQLEDLRDTVEALSQSAETAKDRKIVELVKKNKALSV